MSEQMTQQARIYRLSWSNGIDTTLHTFDAAKQRCLNDASIIYVWQCGILGPQIGIPRSEFLSLDDDHDIYADW